MQRVNLLFLFLVLLVSAGCSSNFLPVGPNPLATQYNAQAPADSAVVVEFGTDTTYGRRTSSFPAPVGGGELSVIVAGMLPSTLYHLRARITLPYGTVTLDPDRTFTSGAVDMSRFPNIATLGNTNPDRGIESINLTTAPGVLPGKQVQAIVTDLSGNLIWYYDHPSSEGFVFPIKFMRNGNVLVTISDYASTSLLREVDLAWNTKREIHLQDLNTALSKAGFALRAKFLHHDMLALPNGHFILLTAEDRAIGSGNNNVIEGDALINLDPELKPVWVWSTFDHFDTSRRPLDVFDWTHSNALVYTSDHNILLSMRNQHWVAKIDYNDGAGNGNVLWRL